MSISVNASSTKLTVIDGPKNQIIKVSSSGPAGPRGLPGDFTLAEINAATQETFIQAVPSATWNVVHSLGGRPSVTVVDSADTICYGDITYVSDTAITITFSAAFSGSCYLS
jgi:hypothetical protein